MTYFKGDRVRVTHRKGNGNLAIQEFTITEDGPHPCGDGIDLNSGGPWTIEVLKKAPVPEPTGFGAVVEFEDPLERIGVRAVRTGWGWTDTDGRDWAWAVISDAGVRVLSEGIE